jgi:hypothetical protein
MCRAIVEMYFYQSLPPFELFFSLLVVVAVAGRKPSWLGWREECSTTVQLWMATSAYFDTLGKVLINQITPIDCHTTKCIWVMLSLRKFADTITISFVYAFSYGWIRASLNHLSGSHCNDTLETKHNLAFDFAVLTVILLMIFSKICTFLDHFGYLLHLR